MDEHCIGNQGPQRTVAFEKNKKEKRRNKRRKEEEEE
jgi:hypothetical protein